MMSKACKIWMIVAAVLIILGATMFAIAMTSHNWNFTKLNTQKYETNTYIPDGEFYNIRIDTNVSDVTFLPSEDSNCRVKCYEPPKEKIKPRRKLRAWEIVLIVLGSPVWAPLLIAACAVALSLYAVLWSVIISLWAVFASLAACAVAFVPTGIALACNGHVTTGVALIGSSMIFTGLAVFAFVGCKEATRGTVILTKKIALGIKKVLWERRRNDE